MIVIPAFDESATIAGVVARALVHAPVLVVDDGSSDDTAGRAASAGADVVRHARRLGKGQAIRTGMTAAAIRGARAVVTLDGDGQHDPDDIPRLRAVADAVPGTLVIGARLGPGPGALRGRLNAVRVAGFFVNWATGLHVEDTQSGFRLYPLDLVRELPTRHGGFVFETEVLIAAARRGLPVREVPVRALPRIAQRSRFRPIVDGVLIGAYLTERGLERWLVEARAAVAGLCAGDVGAWWRHPRRRRATAAAWGTALSPLLLGLVVCQSLVEAVGRLGTRPSPDLVTPVVVRWFSQDRLGPTGRAESGGPAVAASPNGAGAPAPISAPPGVAT
jgi:hypothetical protein